MTILLAEQRELSTTQQQRIARKRKRKMPPGQRLVACAGISALLLLLQGASIPIGAPWHGFNSRDTLAVAEPSAPPPPINLKTSLDALKPKLEQVAAVKDLRAGVFVTDQATGRYVDLNGHENFPAASMIKLPIFIALLNAVDRGRINPDDMIEIKPENVTGGSGWLQWRPIGTKISIRDTADLMIVVSDNTATNMLIDLLGGKEMLNQQFGQWGLASTRINNLLGDFEGTNTTSPYDLVYLLARVDRGELIKPESKKWMNQTMLRTRIRTLLPPGLGPGAKIAHKTGDIACMVGDAGIVTLPSGAKYFVSVQVRRPHNDRRANLLIRALSKMIYQTFSSPTSDGSEVAMVSPEPLAGPAPLRHHRHRHRR